MLGPNPIRARSTFSFRRGASHVEDLVASAKTAGFSSIGLTDRNTAAGHVRFAEACRNHGISPLFGAELAIRVNGTGTSRAATARTGWVSILVRNAAGFRNLARLLSKVPLGSQEAIPLEHLLEAQEGLLALSGNQEDGLLPKLLTAAPDDARPVLARLREAFEDRFYIEIERSPKDARGTSIEARLLDLAHSPSSPCPIIATTPIWYATPDRRDASRLLQAIATGEKIPVTTTGKFEAQANEDRGIAIAEIPSLSALFADLPEALRNANELAERCAYAPEFRKPLLPALALATETPEDALRDACRKGLRERLRTHRIPLPEDAYMARLDAELAIIQATGFASYFLIVGDFVAWARAQGIPVGPGRGSGVGSLAAWALGITEIDPLRHGLLFERFLNPERVSLPDFDIDFCERRRGEVLRYVAERYGSDRVAAISTFAEIKLKSAIKDVARILVHPDGTMLSFQETNAITKPLPSGAEEPKDIQEAIERVPALGAAIAQDPRIGTIIRLAGELQGLYRQSGLHAAGVIIADRSLGELAGIHPNPDGDAKLPQLGLDMGDAEKLGLVKFDFLGLSTTTLIQEAERLIAAMGHPIPSWPELDRDDPRILESFAAGDTFGIFQFESAGMRSALMDVKPTRFSDLVAINALFRPGPIKYIQEFARRKAGVAEFAYPEPRQKTEPILRDTYGIMVYQEQVMEMARVCAGYSLGAADILRRAMGKKKPEEMAKQKAIFLDGDGKGIPGAAALGLPREDAEKLFEDMASFAGYGFNKSHAVAYTDLAWRAMWLKVHHPEAFHCALLNINISDTEKLSAIHEDMRAHRITLLPPDIERSLDGFSIERDRDQKPVIRFGLGGIRHLSDMSEFLSRRGKAIRQGPNALPRLVADSFNSRQIENMAAAGAFDRWLPNRRQMFEALLTFKTLQNDTNQSSLLDTEERDWRERLPPALRNLSDWEDRADRELRATGMTFGIHPIAAHKEFLFQGGARRLKSYLEFMRTRNVTTFRGAKLAFLVTGCVSRTAGKSGGAMLTINAAEETDRYEVFAFESSLKIPIDHMRMVVEASLKLHEPVVATVDLSIDPKNGRSFVKVQNVAPMHEFLLTVPGFYIATLPAGKAIPIHALPTEGTDETGIHRLLLTWPDGSDQVLDRIGLGTLASLVSMQDIDLRRVSEEEWRSLARNAVDGAKQTPDARTAAYAALP